jgi:transposase
MMMKLMIYGYCKGKPSSRKIERASFAEVAYRVLAAEQHPDYDSISEFRKRHLKALSGLFVQVLRLCQRAGLVKLVHVALDGTKIKANNSSNRQQERIFYFRLNPRSSLLTFLRQAH